MPKEHIEREAALIEIGDADDTMDAERRVWAIPAADVVEVVRCRECKYRAEDDFCTGRGWPMQLVADDGFCEKGQAQGRRAGR